tara:strand:- start:13 stop:246 length:234 start_codon:yes stop_codon:yes gene_type:complete
MHDALLGNQAPKKLTMQDVTFMVEKLSPNDAAIIYNTFKFVNDLLNPEMYGHAVSAEVRDQARVCLGLPKVEQNAYL